MAERLDPVRILVDENMDGEVVLRLREAGHDVRWAVETDRRSPDHDLLELATRQRRTLITFNADFGTLVHRDSLPAPYGVIRFRIHEAMPQAVKNEFIANSVMVWDSWPPGVWTVQIRHRPDAVG